MNNSYSTAKTNQGAFECANVPYTGTLFHLAILPGPYLSWIWVRPNLTQSVIDGFWCPKLFVPEQFKVQILSFKLFVFLSLSIIWLPVHLFTNLLYRHCMVFMIKYLAHGMSIWRSSPHYEAIIIHISKFLKLWQLWKEWKSKLPFLILICDSDGFPFLITWNLWPPPFWRLYFLGMRQSFVSLDYFDVLSFSLPFDSATIAACLLKLRIYVLP